MKKATCLRCSHTWYPRKPQRSPVCPGCHSPYWDRPKTKFPKSANPGISSLHNNTDSDTITP